MGLGLGSGLGLGTVIGLGSRLGLGFGFGGTYTYSNNNCIFIECAKSTREPRKLSFAWIAYDVIAKIKETKVLENVEMNIGGANPMYTYLEHHRARYINDHVDDFEKFRRNLDNLITGKESKKAVFILQRYIYMIPGLDSVMFVLMRWGEALELFEGRSMSIYHFLLMFIMFSTGQLASADGNAEQFFGKLDVEEYRRRKKNGTLEPDIPLTRHQRSDMVRSQN